MTVQKKYITVFVPTYNGEPYIKELIEAVLLQDLPKGYLLEFIIIDSGSKDKTVEIIASNYLEKIVFLEIPNNEYGHGKTRQKATEIAKGEYILFLSQDATPQSHRWLINMIEPFFISDKIGAVFGRQVPRPFSVPTIKREVASVFGSLGAPDSIIIHREKSLVDGTPMNQLNSFFSDVNSAVRKDLIEKIPFRDVKYAEDQALAEDIQNNGYLKAYSPAGAVWHSNEYTSREYYYRKFDEYLGLQESTKTVLTKSRKSLFLGWIRPSLNDFKFARKDGEYNRRARLKFIVGIPFYNFSQQLGKYNAIKYLHNPKMRAKISLESRSKD
ncbi:MAG: rfbN [Candidatus Saccharibacteria bacterium]|nr:rfbN [Candidatus Saccharibacteria bacterium]